jgi:hypothetical protein
MELLLMEALGASQKIYISILSEYFFLLQLYRGQAVQWIRNKVSMINGWQRLGA